MNIVLFLDITVSFCFVVKCFVLRNMKHAKLALACFIKPVLQNINFAKQGPFNHEIQNSFCMKLLTILYKRKSSVNPSFYPL